MRTLKYGLMQIDEVEGVGVFSSVQLRRGESAVADAATSIITVALLSYTAWYLSGLKMVDGIVRHI